MNTKIGHCNLKPFVTLNCEDLEFSSEGVSVASCQILMFRHETGSCYISGMLCLFVYDDVTAEEAAQL